jgi:hypothetical protein
LSNTFSIYGQLDAMFGSSKTGVAVETKTNMMNIGVTPAIMVHVSKSVAMNFSFGGLSYESSKVDAAGANTESTLGLNFGKNTMLGLQFNF